MGRALMLLCLLVPQAAQAQLLDQGTTPRIRARHDVMIRWSPRYRLDASTGPLGLQDQMWRRVNMLPMYHRVTLDATSLAGHVDLHFAGWGALDLFALASHISAAGNVAIGYVEVALEPVRFWAGRRFLVFGPPGGLHVDGAGASVRTSFGLTAEAFVGRPVTPTRNFLLGPQPSFSMSTVAYGARLAYADAGRLGASAGYAELWGHGMLSSRTVDLAAYWRPGQVQFQGATKIDAHYGGLMQARVSAIWRVIDELSLDGNYLHLEPGRWIPSWSILSVFETSTYDELSMGTVVRPLRPLSIRVELAGRRYGQTQQGDPHLGYRADLTARIAPARTPGMRLRVHLSRRDNGVIGYTLAQAGIAFDPWAPVTVTFDGAYAIDDAGQRESAMARASTDVKIDERWAVGGTLSLTRSPIVPAEARAMLRASFNPERR